MRFRRLDTRVMGSHCFRHLLWIATAAAAMLAMRTTTPLRALSQPPQTEEGMLELLPASFRVEQTQRFTIYTDARPAWLTTQRQILERTHHQVSRFARRMGWEVPDTIPKQSVILFANRDDYVAFARRHDHVTADWVAGYYSPGNRWVVFYDIESSPSLLDARSRLASMKEELRELQRAPGGAEGFDETSHASIVEHYQAHLLGEQDRVEQFVREVSIATTVHEAAHQLLYAFGIQKAGITYPFWFSEGLATNFETDAPGEAFGPDRPYESRERRLADLLAAGQLEPLDRFIGRADLDGVSRDRVDALYHQAYGFMRWAARFRKDELRAFVRTINHNPPRNNANDLRALFIQAFGDIETVERAWLSYERR